MLWKPSVKVWSTPVVENKRERCSNRLIGYLSSRVSWPSLVTVPFTGDAAVCAHTPDHSQLSATDTGGSFPDGESSKVMNN
jgi:hypothetical protein